MVEINTYNICCTAPQEYYNGLYAVVYNGSADDEGEVIFCCKNLFLWWNENWELDLYWFEIVGIYKMYNDFEAFCRWMKIKIT